MIKGGRVGVTSFYFRQRLRTGATIHIRGRYQQGQAVSQLRIFGQRRVRLSWELHSAWLPGSTGVGPGTVGIWAPGQPLTQAVIEWALFWLAWVVASAAVFFLLWFSAVGDKKHCGQKIRCRCTNPC